MDMKTLETITLADFVDVFFGDTSKVGEGTEQEQIDAASRMCAEYMEIVGGKGVSIHVLKRDNALKIEMRKSLFDACKKLIALDDMEGAIVVMKSVGYSVNKDTILSKIDNLLKMDAYALKKMEHEETPQEEVTREHFVRERVFIMGHLKMYIDDHVFRAKEYAYLVRQVSDEIEAMNKEAKKMK